MKETELETFARVMEHSSSLIEVCKSYHQERLKVELPTEEEIEKNCPDCLIGANWLKNKLLNL